MLPEHFFGPSFRWCVRKYSVWPIGNPFFMDFGPEKVLDSFLAILLGLAAITAQIAPFSG